MITRSMTAASSVELRRSGQHTMIDTFTTPSQAWAGGALPKTYQRLSGWRLHAHKDDNGEGEDHG